MEHGWDTIFTSYWFYLQLRKDNSMMANKVLQRFWSRRQIYTYEYSMKEAIDKGSSLSLLYYPHFN